MDAVVSVMQLTTFTKVTSIPREKNFKDLPVAVRVAAPEMTVQQRAPVDVVAVIDVSWSMGWDDPNANVPNNRLVLVKEAMEKVIGNLGLGGGTDNRLAVVAFDHEIKESTELLEMTQQGQQVALEAVRALKPFGRTDFSIGLNEAAKILTRRGATEKERLAFIIFLTDGDDPSFSTQGISRAYPIHAFGFSADHDPSALQAMADLTFGSYTPVNEDLHKITEKLDELSLRLTSIVAVDTLLQLKSLHPGVLLSKIEPSAAAAAGGGTSTTDSYESQIDGDKQSGEIVVGRVSSGESKEFTVYLDVPEGQGNGADGAMDLLTVGGVYTQSWDQKQVQLGESVVAVARPAAATSGCKELDLIEERLQYWCKVKLDLSAMYDKAEAEAEAGGCQCHCPVTEALREASLEAINRAMHQDVYQAVVHVVKLRKCRCDEAPAGAVTENAPPPTLAQPAAKAV